MHASATKLADDEDDYAPVAAGKWLKRILNRTTKLMNHLVDCITSVRHRVAARSLAFLARGTVDRFSTFLYVRLKSIEINKGAATPCAASCIHREKKKLARFFYYFSKSIFRWNWKKKFAPPTRSTKQFLVISRWKYDHEKHLKKKHYTDLKCFTPPTEIMIHFNFENRSDIHFRIESFSALIVFPSIVRTRPTRPHSQNDFLCCTKCKACGGVRGYGNGMKWGKAWR